MMPPTVVSNSATNRCSSSRRCVTARACAAFWSSSSRLRSIALTLKTSTARAIAPISSARPVCPTVVSRLPEASSVSVCVTDRSGLMPRWTMTIESIMTAKAPKPAATSMLFRVSDRIVS